jgi:hypothetical protein
MVIEFDGEVWNAECMVCHKMVPISNTLSLRLLQDYRCEICNQTNPMPEWSGWQSMPHYTNRFLHSKH